MNREEWNAYQRSYYRKNQAKLRAKRLATKTSRENIVGGHFDAWAVLVLKMEKGKPSYIALTEHDAECCSLYSSKEAALDAMKRHRKFASGMSIHRIHPVILP